MIDFLFNCIILFEIGQPEPTVAWFNGTQAIQTTGAISMARNVIVNRLEVQQVTRDAFNTTYKCQVSNTKLVPPAERLVRLDMLCKYIIDNLCCSLCWSR